MEKRICFFLIGVVCMVFVGARGIVAGPDPVALINAMEQGIRGESHEMKLSMEIKTASWKRDYRFHLWMKGVDKALARVLGPAKVEGQGFLKIQTRLWNYVPTAERTILIPPSMMLDRFMGSDFSNDDFVKMSYLPRDYDPRLLGRELIDNVELYHLELLPKKDAPVTYGKLKVLIRVEDSAPFRIQFYNEKLEHIRTLHYSEYKPFGTHVIPTVWRMEDNRDKKRETTIRISEAKYDLDIPDKIFDQQNLKKYP